MSVHVKRAVYRWFLSPDNTEQVEKELTDYLAIDNAIAKSSAIALADAMNYTDAAIKTDVPSNVASVNSTYITGPADSTVRVTSPAPCTVFLDGNTPGRMITVKNFSASGIAITIQDYSGGTVDLGSYIQFGQYGTAATFTYDQTLTDWSIS